MSNITQPCLSGYIPWIYNIFGDCVVNTKDRVSFYFGLVSTIIWIISAIPQIYTNYKSKRVEGISPFLFSFLLLGDVLCLIGNILTGGMATQIMTSIVYILLDGSMYLQYLYYRSINSNENETSKDNNIENRDSKNIAPVLGVIVAAMFDWGAPYRGSNLIGTIFGWFSSLVYISSRIPQVQLNFKNKFVANLSPFYFICAVLGNLTYLASLGIRSLNGNFLWMQAPWILGAFGPLFCDITTLIQMMVFGFSTVSLFENQNKEKDESENAKDLIFHNLNV